jgi:hypothetical protein
LRESSNELEENHKANAIWQHLQKEKEEESLDFYKYISGCFLKYFLLGNKLK